MHATHRSRPRRVAARRAQTLATDADRRFARGESDCRSCCRESALFGRAVRCDDCCEAVGQQMMDSLETWRRGLVAAQHQREVAAHAERYARTPVGDRWRVADRPPIEPTY